MRIFERFKKKNTQKFEIKESATGAVVSYYNVGQPIWSGRNYSNFAKEGYEQNVVANRCVSLIAKGVAGVKWQLFAGDKEIPKHPLLELLANPNETQSACDFFEAVTSYKLIAGNSYIEAAYPGASLTPNKRPPTYLYSLRADRIKIIMGTKGLPKGYQYEVDSQKVVYPVSKTGVSNILHLKNFNPTDDWYGLSNVEAGAYAVDQHNQSSAWNQSLLQNGARPTGALMIETKENTSGTLSDEQYRRLKENIEDQKTGSQNAGKPMLLEGGLKWVEMGLNPKDMDWLKGKDSAARDVAMAFGVPSQLLGIPGDATYNNMAEARLALWEQTILPELDELTAHLNAWLVPRYGEGLTLKYSEENIHALRIKREMQRESLEKVSFMTINEKRKAIGLDPLPTGGDDILVDSNKIPLSLAEEPPAEPETTPNEVMVETVETLKELGFSKQEIKQMVREDAATNENGNSNT